MFLAFSDSSVILSFGSVLITQIGAFAIAWIKIKAQLDAKTDEIKKHTDTSVTKLNGMLRYVVNSMDRPCYLKLASMEGGRVVFRMLELNVLYERLTGLSRMNYVGKTDHEVGWPEDHTNDFYKNDLLVWHDGRPRNFVERVDGEEHTFRKFRVTTEDGQAKGIMSYQVGVYDCEGEGLCAETEITLPNSLAGQDSELPDLSNGHVQFERPSIVRPEQD